MTVEDAGSLEAALAATEARTVDVYPIFLEFFGLPKIDGGLPRVFQG